MTKPLIPLDTEKLDLILDRIIGTRKESKGSKTYFNVILKYQTTQSKIDEAVNESAFNYLAYNEKVIDVLNTTHESTLPPGQRKQEGQKDVWRG